MSIQDECAQIRSGAPPERSCARTGWASPTCWVATLSQRPVGRTLAGAPGTGFWWHPLSDFEAIHGTEEGFSEPLETMTELPLMPSHCQFSLRWLGHLQGKEDHGEEEPLVLNEPGSETQPLGYVTGEIFFLLLLNSLLALNPLPPKYLANPPLSLHLPSPPLLQSSTISYLNHRSLLIGLLLSILASCIQQD